MPGGEQGRYAFWDPEVWEKGQKELTVLYADLEEKNHPVFAQSQMGTTAPQSHAATQPPSRVGQAFQGIAMGAM